MSESASIFLTGEVLPGFIKEDVIPALARLLKIDEHKAAALLSGRETLIKRSAPPGDVDRYIQALHKVGAVARSTAPVVQSSFPVLSEPITTPAPTPVTPAIRQDQQAPQELSLAPGWSKPGEDTAHIAASSARAEQAVGAGQSLQVSSSGTRRQNTTVASGDTYGREPVYADVPVFGLSTQGRIGRLRYMAYFWPAIGLMIAAGIAAAVILPSMAGGKTGFGTVALIILFAVVVLWMSLRVAVLRLHDLNRTGKWVLLPILLGAAAGAAGSPRLVLMASGVYWILSILLMVWPGSEDDNEYGAPPAPNTEWVIIGAALFLGMSAMGIVGMKQSDKYTAKLLSRASAGASDDDEHGGQTEAFMRNYAEQMDAQTPIMLGSALSLDKVEYADNVLRYNATIQGKGLIIGDGMIEGMKTSMLNSYCGQGNKGGLFPSNQVPVDFVFRYQVTAWDFDSFTLRLSPESC
ncbi:hypothetical protein GCM10027343_09730 [Noviherbaspirillum agri]